MATVRGVARNKNIADFQLGPVECDPQVIDGVLAQLTEDERRKFKVRRNRHGWHSIELCPVGEWYLVSLLMQCLCCASEILSKLNKKAASHFL